MILISLCGLVVLVAVVRPAMDDSPGSVYTFRRTDDEITRVDVGRAGRHSPRISPRLFSNFLEHLGGTIYDGVWANVIYNPQFEADSQGRLVRWSLHGGAEWSAGGLIGRCVRLPPGGSASQLVSLPVHRQRAYRGGIWVFPETGGCVVLEIALRRADKPALLARQTVTAAGEAWARYRLRITVPEGALARGEAAELSITAVTGKARIDMAELFPADARDGVDPDVLRAARDLHITLLRWPGGNFASGYHWRNGIGPRERRPTVQNPAWGGLETHHFGTDEFMRFCGAIGAQPQICVNAGDDTPAEAAAWVEYCNGDDTTPMGRLRAANGHPKPYGVRVWEIGNELYGSWQIGHTDPAGNTARFVRFRDAMRAVDPTIELIATGKGDAFTSGLASDRAWNAALLEAAGAGGQRPPEYLSLHPLVPLPGDLARHYRYEEIYASVMAHPEWWRHTFIPMLRAQVRQATRTDTALRAAVTEWGIIIGGPDWLRYPNHDVQSGAVYAALFFHAMLRAADFVGLANVTALMHGGGIKRPNAVVYLDPMYYVERIYGAARPARLLPVRIEGPGYDVPERGILPAVSDVPWLDVVAAETGRPDRGSHYLFVVNRDPARSRLAEITLPAAPHAAASVSIETLAAAPQQGNSLDRPDAVHPVYAALTVAGRHFARTFPPCSVSLLQWR